MKLTEEWKWNIYFIAEIKQVAAIKNKERKRFLKEHSTVQRELGKQGKQVLQNGDI